MKHWLHSALATLPLSLAAPLHAADQFPANHAPTGYLQVLPSDPDARNALASAPQINIAQQQRLLGEAQARQQADGAHEWVLSSTVQQRKEVLAGVKYQEEDVSLTRAFRWLGKAGLDQSLGEQISATAGYAFEDAWHEAGRSLLSNWFDWLRASSEARLLTQQLALFEAQLAATEKRVQAGDAPRIETQLALAELARAQAAQTRAQQNADLLALSLHSAFPTLELRLPTQLDVPQALIEDDERWIRLVVDNNHEIELAQGEADVAKLAAQRAKRDRIADPSIGVHYGRERDAQERIVGVTFSIPLPGAARQNAYQSAQADALRRQRMVEQIQLKVERDAHADVLAMHSTFKQWQLLASLAEQAQRNADIVARAYALGEFGLSETQLARRQALDSAIAAQTAQLDALQAQARLWLDAHQLWALDHNHEHPGSTRQAGTNSQAMSGTE
ncbi:MAG: TolC family protein [Steroidobacteraceae bacterium]